MKKFLLKFITFLCIHSFYAAELPNDSDEDHINALGSITDTDKLFDKLEGFATYNKWYEVSNPLYSALMIRRSIRDVSATENTTKLFYGMPRDAANGCCSTTTYYLVFQAEQFNATTTVFGKRINTEKKCVVSQRMGSFWLSFQQVFDGDNIPCLTKNHRGMYELPAYIPSINPVYPKLNWVD